VFGSVPQNLEVESSVRAVPGRCPIRCAPRKAVRGVISHEEDRMNGGCAALRRGLGRQSWPRSRRAAASNALRDFVRSIAEIYRDETSDLIAG
jgi:hypothetical protein